MEAAGEDREDGTVCHSVPADSSVITAICGNGTGEGIEADSAVSIAERAFQDEELLVVSDLSPYSPAMNAYMHGTFTGGYGWAGSPLSQQRTDGCCRHGSCCSGDGII